MFCIKTVLKVIMNPKNNRSITDHDRLVAKNTKAIYATNKKALGLTLVLIAEKLSLIHI